MTSLNWNSEFILVSNYILFILIYIFPLYSYLGTYFTNELFQPLSFPFSSMGLSVLNFISLSFSSSEFPFHLLPVIPEKVVWSRTSQTRFPASSILSVGYKAYRQQWLLCPFFPLYFSLHRTIKLLTSEFFLP